MKCERCKEDWEAEFKVKDFTSPTVIHVCNGCLAKTVTEVLADSAADTVLVTLED